MREFYQSLFLIRCANPLKKTSIDIDVVINSEKGGADAVIVYCFGEPGAEKARQCVFVSFQSLVLHHLQCI